MDMLHKIVIDTTDELMTSLKIHSNFLPSEEQLELGEIYDVVEISRPEGVPQVTIVK